MNRLIIIGNGFDLAHGLKTSFKDFIANYLFNVLEKYNNDFEYNDELVYMENNREGVPYYVPMVEEGNSISVFKQMQKEGEHFIKIRSTLLKNILNRLEKSNWVDIESEFFQILVNYRRGVFYGEEKSLVEINKKFEHLKGLLIKYLKKQEGEFIEGSMSNKLYTCMIEDINEHDEMSRIMDIPNKIMFLNFNYTNVAEYYYKKGQKIYDIKGRIDGIINYIHGSLDGKNGNPVFGFGDEHNKDYKELEEQLDNRYFHHIKSFEYLKTNNFNLLNGFMDSADFQVHIYGHSCGVTDRTLLNKIFEHENCINIKIFYHGTEMDNDYTEKTFEISRHFKDKDIMRKKILPFTSCKPMPQPIEEYKAKVNGQS